MANADQSDVRRTYSPPELLPEPLPSEPMQVARAWFDAAHQRKDQPNPNAMTLASIDADGHPSARIVLCKAFHEGDGFIVFYTNYESRKGAGLRAHPHAAVCFHWDHADRQVRIEGPVVKSPEAESDTYFASRPWESKLGAWASAQSQAVASRQALLDAVDREAQRLGLDASRLQAGDRSVSIPRPPHWGGWRLWAHRVELWVGGPGRVHDRAAWTRSLEPDGAYSFRGSAWSATRLQP